MNSYDFTRLNDKDFEDLVIDLISAQLILVTHGIISQHNSTTQRININLILQASITRTHNTSVMKTNIIEVQT